MQESVDASLEGSHQGFARAIRVLNKVLHDRVIQKVQTIYEDCRGSHALHHKQHYSIPAWNASLHDGTGVPCACTTHAPPLTSVSAFSDQFNITVASACWKREVCAWQSDLNLCSTVPMILQECMHAMHMSLPASLSVKAWGVQVVQGARAQK